MALSKLGVLVWQEHLMQWRWQKHFRTMFATRGCQCQGQECHWARPVHNTWQNLPSDICPGTCLVMVKLRLCCGSQIFSPTCQVRVVRFLDVMTSSFLPSFLLPPPRRTSLASSWLQWDSPDFICRLAGLHLPVPDRRGSRRTFAVRQFLWALPGFYGPKIAVGLAGLLRLENRCGRRRTFTAGKSLWAPPDFLRQIECQIEYQKECEIECQIECQKECQNTWQIDCQNICQIIYQNAR